MVYKSGRVYGQWWWTHVRAVHHVWRSFIASSKKKNTFTSPTHYCSQEMKKLIEMCGAFSYLDHILDVFNRFSLWMTMVDFALNRYFFRYTGATAYHWGNYIGWTSVPFFVSFIWWNSYMKIDRIRAEKRVKLVGSFHIIFLVKECTFSPIAWLHEQILICCVVIVDFYFDIS